MKFVNICLSLGIGLYYSVATDAVYWGDMYYTVLIGFCLVCLLQDDKALIDRYFAVDIVAIIWVLYESKPFINQEIFPWIRFITGILFVVLGIIYTLYSIKEKLQHDN